MKKIFTIKFMRSTALIVLLVAALASLDMLLKAGRNSDSFLLLVLFAGWQLSPFTALLIANAVSIRWMSVTRKTLYWLMILLSIGSVISYSGILSPQGSRPASIFLIVPLISWILILIIIARAVFRSRKQLDESAN